MDDRPRDVLDEERGRIDRGNDRGGERGREGWGEGERVVGGGTES